MNVIIHILPNKKRYDVRIRGEYWTPEQKTNTERPNVKFDMNSNVALESN